MVLFSYPMILSPDKLPGDLADTRFIHYILEHGWLWFHQKELHTSIWNMPIFYDNENTLAYSDFMFGAMAVYIPIREFFSAHTALKIWFIIVCCLNYFSMYFFLRKCFKFNIFPSSVGAFLFAFSLPRSRQIEHIQLLCQFFMVISCIAFFHIDNQKTRIKNNLYFFIGCTFFSIQIYTCFYYGWFMVFCSIILFITMLLFSDKRKKILEFIKYFYPEIIIYSIYTILITTPLCQHYLAVGTQFSYNLLFLRVLKPIYLLSSNSYMDGLLYSISDVYGANMMGVGFITSAAVLYGLFQDKQNRKLIFLSMTIILLFFMIKDLNYFLYKIFPGASAIRVSSRIILIFLIFYSYYLTNFLQNFKYKYFSILIAGLIILEQYCTLYYNWSSSEHFKNLRTYKIPQNCNVIYYDFNSINSVDEYVIKNVDVMWLGIEGNFKTVNGYSGNIPKLDIEKIPKECIVSQAE